MGGVGGSVTGATRSTVGGVAQTGVATPLKAIQINSGAQTESQGSANSSFSTRHGDLKLDSGTQMEFRVAGQGSAQAK